ncbi:hypothetical protein EJ419_05030 [Alloscardovia theropitheci]|uniref:Uncharacterized protein n=1 Tax=Alloscardovia theropitheci TaxID=2496842 RepID=A0A4V2MUA1_9BIFI|nr:hypothetical protein [Alloscardovia theropitheci]TCD54029.1 hypothetical protein EJ419_05030 [Alloscardovia theropitheci]
MGSVQYALTLPEQWNQFELTDDNISEVARKNTDNLISTIPALAKNRAKIYSFWHSQLQHARSVGIRHVASYFEQADDKPVIALMQVQIMPLPPVEADSTVLDTLYDAFNRVEPERPELPDIAIIQQDNIGKGVRCVAREFLSQDAGEQNTEVIMMRTIFPLQTCAFGLNFMTPNVGEALPLCELFELITSTLDVQESVEE